MDKHTIPSGGKILVCVTSEWIFLNFLFLFFLFNNFIYLFLAMLGLHCFMDFSLVVASKGQ